MVLTRRGISTFKPIPKESRRKRGKSIKNLNSKKIPKRKREVKAERKKNIW